MTITPSATTPSPLTLTTLAQPTQLRLAGLGLRPLPIPPRRPTRDGEPILVLVLVDPRRQHPQVSFPDGCPTSNHSR